MITRGSCAIELRGVGRTYSNGVLVEALRSADLSVVGGSFVAIVGPSGSGKSTLLSILGLLDRPTSGTYRLNGTDTRELSERDRCSLRAREIGFVFQDYHLISALSTLENVEVGLAYTDCRPRDWGTRASAALATVGLESRLHADVRVLSGGERQRVAIARAIASDPSILLCDEPTGNLDSVTGASVMAALRKLHSTGLTLITVTHDPEVARMADRIVTIRDGKVHE